MANARGKIGGNVTGQDTGLEIRQAVESDREALVACMVEAFADVRRPGEVLDRIWQEWQADLPRSIDISNVIIAEVGGKAVGFASFRLNDATRIGTVDDNAVLPAYRGRGIGGLLLARVLAMIAAAGMEFAQVSTGLDEPYAPARRMYERHGFAPLHRSVAYFKKLAQRPG